MPYATVAELKNQINLTKVDTDLDTFLQKLLDGAERAMNGVYNRQRDGFVAPDTAVIRYFTTNGTTFARIDECVEITAVGVKDSPTDDEYEAWATPTADYAGDGDWMPCSGSLETPTFGQTPYTGLITDPNGDYETFPISPSRPSMTVTARWGYATEVPAEVKEVTIMQAARWYRVVRASMTRASGARDLGTIAIPSRVDADIRELIYGSRLMRPMV